MSALGVYWDNIQRIEHKLSLCVTYQTTSGSNARPVMRNDEDLEVGARLEWIETQSEGNF